VKKITALCVAAVLIFGGVLHTLAAPRHPKQVVNAVFLQGVYDEYNREYFDDNLPHNVAIMYAEDPTSTVDNPDIGDTECQLDLVTHDPINCTIYVSPYANVAQSVAVETVIHEMCHVATFKAGLTDGHGSHGKEWTACMMNVAKAGGMDGVW
jgi:hypothetical protein